MNDVANISSRRRRDTAKSEAINYNIRIFDLSIRNPFILIHRSDLVDFIMTTKKTRDLVGTTSPPGVLVFLMTITTTTGYE